MSKSYLKEYATLVTVGAHGERATEYSDWKKEQSKWDPDCTAQFRALENPQSWNGMFATMIELGWLRSDVLEHIQYSENAGNYALANAIRTAAARSSNYERMDTD